MAAVDLCFDVTNKIVAFIAVRIYRFVMIMGLWSKYDVDGHYFIFAGRILVKL